MAAELSPGNSAGNSESQPIRTQEGSSDETQRRDVTVIAEAIGQVLLRPQTNTYVTYIDARREPEREKSTDDSLKSKPKSKETRQERKVARHVIAMFEKTTRKIRAFDPEKSTEDEEEIQSIPQEMVQNQYTAVLVGSEIYCLLEDGTNYKLDCAVPRAEWIRLETRKKTHDVRAVYSSGKIYAFEDSEGGCSLVEELSMKVLSWSNTTSKPIPGCEIMIAENKGLIYCIGGLGKHTLSDVICFNTKTRKWETLPNMLTPRHGGGAAVLNEKIYVMGGREGGFRHESTECFDIKTKTWTELAKLNKQHYIFNACIIGGKIYAVEGRNSDNSIEEYDPSEDKWNIVKIMKGQNIVPLATLTVPIFC